jgi:hypothetical protein
VRRYASISRCQCRCLCSLVGARASSIRLRTVVICRLFSSHEETSEIPLSSSIVLRRFPPISDDRETTRSILVRDALPSWENALPLRRRESAFSHRYSILRKGVCFLVRPPVQIIGCKPGATWIGLIICATKHVALSVASRPTVST